MARERAFVRFCRALALVSGPGVMGVVAIPTDGCSTYEPGSGGPCVPPEACEPRDSGTNVEASSETRTDVGSEEAEDAAGE
jgi:hypothetical protein